MVRRGYAKTCCVNETKSLDEGVLGLDRWPVVTMNTVMVPALKPLCP